MTEIPRLHECVLLELLRQRRRIIFITGPHRVGKSAPCHALASARLDWDDLSDRRLILLGPEAVAHQLGLPGTRAHETGRRSREAATRIQEPGPRIHQGSARDTEVVLALDNLHRFRKWRHFLRKLAARYSLSVLVTGTAAFDAASMKPRQLGCQSSVLRVHPWSVAECAHRSLPSAPIRAPAAIADADWNALLHHGGFPEPFLRRDAEFTRTWRAHQQREHISEDLLSLGALRDADTAQVLAVLLAQRSGEALNYSQLSRELGVAVDTVRRWVDLLIGLQLGFRLRPWSVHVPKALRREPRWFVRDWSSVVDPEARERTFIACHLLKAVQGWTDLGFGRFELFYVRDKLERAADFLVVRDRKPWFLAQLGSGPIPAALGYLQRCIRAEHAFQLEAEAAFADFDCFANRVPTAVPARTLLSQLL